MRAMHPSGPRRPRFRVGAAGAPGFRGTTALGAAIGLAVLAAPAAAQQGTITYTHVVKREVAAPGGGQRGGPPRFGGGQQFTPPPRTGTVVVHFDPAASLMVRQVPERRGGERAGQRGDRDGFDRPRPDGAGRGGGRFFGGGGGANRGEIDPYAATQLEAAYIDGSAGTMVEARSFLGRTFRVTRERPVLEWAMTADQAEHLGYMVIKATAEVDSATTIEAWFAPQIPVSGGPASYGGLPGMILVLSVNDGQIQYQATEVSLAEVDEGLISPPDEGDEISEDDFERLVRERLEEMARMRRPPGGDGRQ